MASCAYVLLAVSVVGTHQDANSRILQGLITGMGFIGGGAILKEGGGVRGTATAASIWTTGAVGSAVGYGRYEIALVVSLITLLVLMVLNPVERAIGKRVRPERAEDDE